MTVWRFGRLTTTGGPPSSSALRTLEIHSAQTVRQQVRQDEPEKEGRNRNSTQTDGSSHRHGSSNSRAQTPYQTVVWNTVTAVADVVYSVRGTRELGEKYPLNFKSPLSYGQDRPMTHFHLGNTQIRPNIVYWILLKWQTTAVPFVAITFSDFHNIVYKIQIHFTHSRFGALTVVLWSRE